MYNTILKMYHLKNLLYLIVFKNTAAQLCTVKEKQQQHIFKVARKGFWLRELSEIRAGDESLKASWFGVRREEKETREEGRKEGGKGGRKQILIQPRSVGANSILREYPHWRFSLTLCATSRPASSSSSAAFLPHRRLALLARCLSLSY